jgi:GNAT superfamily N-acetyltransferase
MMQPVQHQQYRRGEFTISTDPAKLDVPAVHAFLTQSYWAEGIPLPVVERSIQNSLCFGLYEGKDQIGFARVVSDLATYAYLADVYVLEKYRRRGLAKWLMACVQQHPELQGLRRWGLVTRDAHALYEQFGFTRPAKPEGYMEKLAGDIYKKSSGKTRVRPQKTQRSKR